MLIEAIGTALYVRKNGMNTMKDEIHFFFNCLLHDKLSQDLFPLFWKLHARPQNYYNIMSEKIEKSIIVLCR